MGVRQCGAGRSRTICGPKLTGLSYFHCVRWFTATLMANFVSVLSRKH